MWQQRDASWTSAIYPHTGGAWSYNIDLFPIPMYFNYSLNSDILFIFDLSEKSLEEEEESAALWQQKDLAFVFAILVATVPRGIGNALKKKKKTAYIRHNLHHK